MQAATVIRYAGTYRFEHRMALERALRRVRERIDHITKIGGGWLRCFIMLDTTLTVNIALPARPEHRATADLVFATLSRHALEGSVHATISDLDPSHERRDEDRHGDQHERAGQDRERVIALRRRR
jgi:hypothetical protein